MLPWVSLEVKPIILGRDRDPLIQEGEFVRLDVSFIGAPRTILRAEQLGAGALIC